MRVIVTGADGTLGMAVFRRFSAAGYRTISLYGGDVPPELPGSHLPSGDLADEANARDVIDRAAGDLGGVDALVHVAGAFHWAEVGTTTLSDWRRMFDINLATAVAAVTASLPHLAEGAAIVLVGANSAQPAGAGFGPYGAAKAGVARLVEALSAELKYRRIRVNAILPAILDTPRNRADMPDADPSDWTSPEAVADTIAFLVSPAARAVNGALLPVTNAA